MNLTNTQVFMNYLSKYQYGGIIDMDKIKKSFNNQTTQQDNTSKKPISKLQPRKADKDMFNRTIPNAPVQGTVHLPYNKSIRESMLSGLGAIDREGKSEVAKIVTEPLKSGLRLLRPDRYFENVRSDADVGGALGTMGMDALNVAPVLEGAGSLINRVKNIPIRVGLDPNVDYFSQYMKTGDMSVEGYNKFYANVDKKPLKDVIADKTNALLDKPFIPVQKRVLPDNIKFETTTSVGGNTNAHNGFQSKGITITAKGSDGRDYGYIRTAPYGASTEWHAPGMISVNPELQGNRMQDVLYQAAIDQVKPLGFKGVQSGNNLLSPAKTIKAYDRFDKEILGSNVSDNIQHPVVGLTQHQNPNVITDWLDKYKTIPKKVPQKLSINDVLDKAHTLIRGRRIQQEPWQETWGQGELPQVGKSDWLSDQLSNFTIPKDMPY